MRWQGRRESDNIEDRRYDEGGYNDGPGGGFPFPGGGGFQIPMGLEGGIGGGGIIGLLVIVGIALLLGVDPRVILGGGGGGGMEMPSGGRQSKCRIALRHRPPMPATTPSSASSRWCWATPRTYWTEIFPRAGSQLHTAEARAVPGRHPIRLRARQRAVGAVLLSNQPQDLHRPVLLRPL